MRIELTPEEQEILEHASQTCDCESYYSYYCVKCRQTGKGFVTSRDTAYTALAEAGYLAHSNYHGLVLTESGRTLAKQVGIRLWYFKDFDI